MEFDHDFEELGIPLVQGWCFGSFGGKCTVEYTMDGYWTVTAIWVRIDKFVNGMWSRKYHRLDTTDKAQLAHFNMLKRAIERVDRAEIDEAVQEALPITYERASMFNDAGRTL